MSIDQEDWRQMEHGKSKISSARRGRRSIWGSLLLLITRVVLPLLILAAGTAYAIHLVETRPKSKRMPARRQARLVEVVEVERRDVPVAYTT